MGRYLRDEQLTNLTISEESIRQVSDLFVEKANNINQPLPNNGLNDLKGVVVTYTIRFDNKGYRYYNVDHMLRDFRAAKKVERVIIRMESAESMNSNQAVGTCTEARFDMNMAASILLVTTDSSDWVESTYTSLSELIVGFKNKHGYIRSGWTPFLIQISGVILGFGLSIWAAYSWAPKLLIDNAVVVIFLFAFLFFSNIWSYLNPKILLFIDILFPNVKFQREDKDRLHWLVQILIGSSLVAILFGMINQAFNYIFFVLNTYVA